MPIPENRIGGPVGGPGGYTFLALRGATPTPQERIERITWPGVDYARYRQLGYGTDPFRLQSVVNVADQAEGLLRLTGYSALKTNGLQQLIWNDYDFDTDSLRVQVLQVDNVELHAVNQWCGSFDDTDGWRLVANWTLEFKNI